MFESWLTVENVVVLSAWLIFTLTMLVFVVPKLAASRVSQQFGLVEVTQNGKKFFAPVDPAGEPVQIPIGMRKVNGEDQVVMGYAPLAFCLPYMAADMASFKFKLLLDNFKMSFLGAKGNSSKRLKGAVIDEVNAGNISLEDAMPLLPLSNKAKTAIAIAKSLGLDFKGPGADDELVTVHKRRTGQL